MKTRSVTTQMPYREWLAAKRIARERGLTLAAAARLAIRLWMANMTTMRPGQRTEPEPEKEIGYDRAG